MVNNSNPRRLVVGKYKTRKGAKNRTKITNGPVYDLSIVKQLVALNGIHVINTQANEDREQDFDPELTRDEVSEIIKSLRQEDHYLHEGSEICDTSIGMKVDSDEYCIFWNRARNCEDPAKQFGRPVYIKFGFGSLNKCLIISIHNSRK